MHLDIWIFATKYTMKYKYIERETSKKGERREVNENINIVFHIHENHTISSINISVYLSIFSKLRELYYFFNTIFSVK